MNAYLTNLTLRLARGVSHLEPNLRERYVAFVRERQREDGGFGGRDGTSDLYYTGFALRGLALCGELSGPVAERAAKYLEGRLTGQAPIVDFLSLI